MKPLYFSFILFLSFFFLINNNTSVSAKKSYRSKIKFCKWDVFLECLLEPLAYFTHQINGSGIASTEEEMEQFCFNIHDYFPVCAQQWIHKCGTQLHAQLLLRFFIEPYRQSFRDFCNSTGSIRTQFLKYSSCLIHQVKLSPSYRSICIRQLQAGQEYIAEQAKATGNITQTLTSFCCNYNNWEACIVEHLTAACGPASGQVFPNLIHHGSMMMLKTICPLARYDPKNPEKCDKSKFLAPKGYLPKGFKSLSFASYLFSYSCPNVGFGIDEKRDF